MGFDSKIIEEKRFTQTLRGYNTDEVDEFLDELVIEFDKLSMEVQSLSEQLESYRQKESSMTSMEKTLRDTLTTAQKAAEDVITTAHKKADSIIADGEIQARKSFENITYQIERGKSELEKVHSRIKSAKSTYRAAFEAQIKLLDDINFEGGDDVVSEDVPTSDVMVEDKLNALLETDMQNADLNTIIDGLLTKED